MDAEILSFLTTGKLIYIEIGMLLKDVIALLNIPSSEMFDATRRRSIWESENLTLSFFKGILDIISVECTGNKIELPPQILNREINFSFVSYENFKSFFEENNLFYEVYERECFEERLCLKLSSGILIYFQAGNLSKIVSM